MAKPKHILLVVLLLALFTSCACDANHVLVRTPNTSYRVKKGSIVHNDNGCITFDYSVTDEEPFTKVEVCGTYTIEN